MLRRSLAIAGFAIVLTSCRGSNVPGQALVPAPAQAQASASNGTVVVTLPPIISGTPVPAAVALSSATRSIAGAIGKTRFAPIPLSAAAPQCTPAPAGLTCTLTLTARPGDQTVSLKTYASANGTGSQLALGTARVRVYAGSTSYPTSPQWIGLAKRLSLTITPSAFVQGQEAGVSAIAYGVDAGGAPIPNRSIRLGGVAVSDLYASWSGLYYGSQTMSLTQRRSLFLYNGIFGGTEHFALHGTGSRNALATSDVAVSTGAAGNAQVFAQGGFVNADRLYGMVQYVTGSSSSATPLRTLFLPSFLTTARDDGSFWALSPGLNSLFMSAGAFAHYDRSGNMLERVPATYPGATPGSAAFILAATLDAAGDAYVVDAVTGSPPILNVYAARAYTASPVRSITIGSTGVAELSAQVRPYMAVDAAGNAYLAYTQCFRTCTMYVYEYGPSQTGNATPIRSIAVGWIEGLAVDPSGNLYTVDCGSYDNCYMTSWLNKYTPGSVKTTIVGSASHFFSGVATDGSGKVYAVAQSLLGSRTYQPEVEIFAPGTTTPSETIVGPVTTLSGGLISTQIAVAP